MESETPSTTSNETSTPSDADSIVAGIQSRLTERTFDDWHLMQERKRNAEEGYGDTRNDPSHMVDDDTHSPSSLLSCHRMSYYKANNTPRESNLPYGIFKFGHDFEAYVEEFLAEEIVTEGTEVRNVERVNFDKDGLQFVGSTDPVVFNDEGVPVALFEVKTTKNTHFVRQDGQAKEQHRAQAHAYAKGLQHKYDLEEPPEIFFIYGGREDLDVFLTSMSFDTDFWEETVVEWAKADTGFRASPELPPTVEKSKEYMCGYCDFKERCGNYEPTSKSPNSSSYVENMDDYWWDDSIDTDIQNTFEDMPVDGFLPLKQYPESAVVAHLATYPDVKLTPTLAVQHPDLVADGEEPPERFEKLYGAAPQAEVGDWVCPKCLQTHAFDEFEWDGDFENRPTCPDCSSEPQLRGRIPGEVLL